MSCCVVGAGGEFFLCNSDICFDFSRTILLLKSWVNWSCSFAYFGEEFTQTHQCAFCSRNTIQGNAISLIRRIAESDRKILILSRFSTHLSASLRKGFLKFWNSNLLIGTTPKSTFITQSLKIQMKSPWSNDFIWAVFSFLLFAHCLSISKFFFFICNCCNDCFMGQNQ